MLQLIRHITKDPSDRTRMSLIFANQVSSAELALSLEGQDGMFAQRGARVHAPHPSSHCPCSAGVWGCSRQRREVQAWFSTCFCF